MAITFSVKVDPGSIKEIQRAFEGIKDGVRNRVLKQSIGKVARRAAKVAKEKAPRGPTGTLKKSMGTRYKSYQRGNAWIYAIGPRTKFRGIASHQPKRMNKKGEPQEFIPTKYAHMAEYGRKQLRARSAPLMLFYPTPKAMYRIGRVKVKRARGFKFMEKTYKLLNSPSARLSRMLIEDILAGIDREAAKYSARGKSVMVS